MHKIESLPKWAQAHIAQLEERVKRAELTLPWTEPNMEWFTVLHPATKAKYRRDTYTKLFVLHENRADPVCSIGPDDFLFVGRGKNKLS